MHENKNCFLIIPILAVKSQVWKQVKNRKNRIQQTATYLSNAMGEKVWKNGFIGLENEGYIKQ